MLEKIRNHFRRVDPRIALTTFGRTGIPRKLPNPFLAEMLIPLQMIVLGMMVSQLITHLMRPTYDFVEQPSFDWLYVFYIFVIAFLLAVNFLMAFWQIRRHHDLGLSGWHVLKPYGVSLLIAVAFPVAAYFSSFNGPLASYMGTLWAFPAIYGAMLAYIGIAGFVLRKVYFLKYHNWIETTHGDPKTNRYGPPPPGSLPCIFA
ncbi:hypothetical protein [Hyphobacterium sp.]|uniref:hypothetical protein n=1 Tax=Hyphobacterium sp. TaxID=2004662 RepID=UPI003749EF54